MEKFSKARQDVNRFSLSQKILSGLIVFLIIFGGITRFSQGNIFSDFAYNSFTMLRYSLIEGPVKGITSFSSDLSELYKVRDENDDLRSQLSSQKMYKTQLEESNRRLKELEGLTGLTKTMDFEATYCNVVNRDIEAYSNTITIDKGSNDGIVVNNAVICSKGLIGKVSEVSSNYSKVKLLTTESGDNAVSIKIELSKESTTDGILQNFDASSGKYNIVIFDSNAPVKKGMNVISSGEGGVYPGGIIVGSVSKVTSPMGSTGKLVTVTPSVDYSDFEYIAVLKGSNENGN